MRCEDCDTVLLSPSNDVSMGGMDIDLEHAGIDGRELSCMDCGRMVCETCAVVQTGIGRECLECRMR